jgi:hypothetical protein
MGKRSRPNNHSVKPRLEESDGLGRPALPLSRVYGDAEIARLLASGEDAQTAEEYLNRVRYVTP